MKNLLDRLKPEYHPNFRNREWSYDSLKWRLQEYSNVGDLKLRDIWMMESEFLISLKNIYDMFNLFNDEEN